MKIALSCPVCARPGVDVYQILNITHVNDAGVYDCECKIGHKFSTVFQDEKFEFLFEIGLNAIYDGYYREAVSCFASALEDFYVFFIQIVSRGFDIKQVDINSALRNVSKSERQIGAFVFLYLVATSRPPDLLKSKYVNFRNKMVHKGYIPTKDEAIEYGEEVRALLWDGIIVIKSKFGNCFHQAVTERMESLYDQIPIDHQKSGASGICFLVSLTRNKSLKTISDYLEDLKSGREKKGIK